MLFIRIEKLLLLSIFTFNPKKSSWLPAFTSFHSIHMQKFTKIFCGCEVIHKKRESFLPQMISNIQYQLATASMPLLMQYHNIYL